MDYGRVRTVAKGARREKSKNRSLLQAFHPLIISFTGRGEVKTLGAVEPGHGAIILQGERLFSGMYVNEILCRLLHNHEEHKSLYINYQDTLIALQGDTSMELVLRKFELNLLAELGYAINLEEEYLNHQPIKAGSVYRFSPEVGFELAASEELQAEKKIESSRSFSGEHLIAIREEDLSDKSTAQAAKRLMRIALAPHLGDKPLNSRRLFQSRS